MKTECVGGFLMEKEVKYLDPMLHNPPKPMVAIIGGAKVSSKIAVLESLLKNASTLVIGGGMSYTFLKAQGHSVGKSLVEDDFIDTAKKLLSEAKAKGVNIILPVDHRGEGKYGLSYIFYDFFFKEEIQNETYNYNRKDKFSYVKCY